MLAKYEFRRHHENSKVWFGRYLSPLNPPHWHEDAEILYCKEGEAEISVDDQVVYLQEGDACYVSSEQIHWVKVPKERSLIPLSSMLRFWEKKALRIAWKTLF